MDEIAVAVDLTYVRGVANRVTQAADTIAALRFPGVSVDLPGSAVAGAIFPAVAAVRRDGVIAQLSAWATAARRSAAAFENTDRNTAARIDVS